MRQILGIFLLGISIATSFGQKFTITVDTVHTVTSVDVVNSEYNDFFVIPLGDSVLFISSDRGQNGVRPDFINQKHFESIWISRKKHEEWIKPKPLRFENNITDISLVGYSTDSLWFLVYDGSLNDGDLLIAKRKKDQLIRPQPLFLDLDNSRETSGFLDSKRRKLYFTSDRKGSIGGLDIWVADIDEEFQCTHIRNLGPTINSSVNEHSIWIRNDTMWFASQGHVSVGGFDIFYTIRLDDDTWSPIQSMGNIINTTSDEVSYSPVTGTWCSTREEDNYHVFKHTVTLDTIRTLLPKDKEKEVIVKDTQSIAVQKVEKLVIPISLEKEVIENVQDIRKEIGEEIEYCMVQLITYQKDGPNAISPQAFLKRWNIDGYPIDTSHRFIEGIEAVSYLLDRKFYDDDHMGIEKAVVYKREFISKYPAFDYQKVQFKPFINVYTQSGQRRVIYFDQKTLKYILVN